MFLKNHTLPLLITPTFYQTFLGKIAAILKFTNCSKEKNINSFFCSKSCVLRRGNSLSVYAAGHPVRGSMNQKRDSESQGKGGGLYFDQHKAVSLRVL